MKYLKNPYILSVIVTGFLLTALFCAIESEGGVYCPFNSASINTAPASSANDGTVASSSNKAFGATNREAQNDDSPSQSLTDAPDFTLTNMEGEPFTMSEHKGKVIVLNIWATWCPPCREEIPDFVELQDEMRDDDVLFVGVSVDESGWDVVKPFADDYQINYPIVVDDGTINNLYGPFPGLPTTFFINKVGQVEHVAPGMVNKAMIEPLLKEMATR
ncbi:MAG: TlpA disulfide reductase family protein [Balneolales bacterium]